MFAYIIRRILLMPILLFGVTILIFLMISMLSPDERLALYLRDLPRNPAQAQSLIRRYGLDQPILVQYGNWLFGREVDDPTTGKKVIQGGILRGDFGYSRSGSDTVANIIKRRFPATVELALWSAVPIVVVGIWMGIRAAVSHNKLPDQILRVFSIIGYSFPSFVFGLLVLMIFYARLQWFPPDNLTDWASRIVQNSAVFTRYTGMNTFDALLNGRLDILLDALRHMVLPILTLAYIQWALLLRVTRSSMLESLRQDYVTTARAKGLAERDVIYRHARPNAMIPVVTVSGFTIVGLLNGVVITETIFNYPGIGSVAARAAQQLDVLTVLGFTLFNGLILLFANLVVDVLYAVVDPRVRLG
ncbi:MAG TPA: ABC transporter permease [Anaerolineae bacterium]|nr:ABC transporter permease [Anaerolineae bacterium]